MPQRKHLIEEESTQLYFSHQGHQHSNEDTHTEETHVISEHDPAPSSAPRLDSADSPAPILLPAVNDSLLQAPKRKRVTRLCDECRRKKVKCDGQQPCIHCTVYSYECTYNQPSTRKRTDTELQRPDVSRQDSTSNIVQLEPQISADKLLAQYEQFVAKLLPELRNANIFKLNSVLQQWRSEKPQEPNVKLQELVHLYNISAIRNIYPSGSSSDVHSPQSSSSTPLTSQAQAIDGSIESLVGKEIKIILPPKEILVKLISLTWDNTCVLFRFYHRPSFIKQLSILYETDPVNYTDTQQKFLPLVYSVMLCGSLFYKSSQVTKNSIGQTKEELDIFDDEGYRYFILLRKLIDITDTRDIYGIQTIVMLVLFLQCGARLSTCYSYVGIGLRALLREGFHRRLKQPFNPIELEVRKRIFWTVYKMDIYVNAMLGLPMSLDDEDFDQDFPIELDDENITETGYNFSNQKGLSSSAILNAHTKLLMVMKKVVHKLYPINKKQPNVPPQSMNDIVYNLELELQGWVNELPLELKPGIEPHQRYCKANKLLHFAYLHIKIILYRPFIHYISRDFRDASNIYELQLLEKLKNSINVARIVVKLSEDMVLKDMLSGSYWFSVYTIFFSVLCLVYYVHFGPGVVDEEYMLIKLDLERGKKVLEILKNSTTLARRTFNILNSVFEQMNRNTAARTAAVQKLRLSQEKATGDESKVGGDQIVNGINYINGKGTGIELKMSVPTPINSEIDSNEVKLGSEDGGSGSVSAELPRENVASLTDLTLRGVTLDLTLPGTPLQATPLLDLTLPGILNGKYIPGIIDKFDERIFGKFLPPYMNSDFAKTSTDLLDDLQINGTEFDDFQIPGFSETSATSSVPLSTVGSSYSPTGSTIPSQPLEPGSGSEQTQPFSEPSGLYNFDELLNEWAHDNTYK